MTLRKSAEAIVTRHRREKGRTRLYKNEAVGWLYLWFCWWWRVFYNCNLSTLWQKIGLRCPTTFSDWVKRRWWVFLRAIQKHLECGQVYRLSYKRYGWHPHVELKVSSIKEIRDKLIPFFRKNQLHGKKRHSFELFAQAAELFYTKQHLTLEGIEQLKAIRSKMNRYSKKGGRGFAMVRENRVPSGERRVSSDR